MSNTTLIKKLTRNRGWLDAIEELYSEGWRLVSWHDFRTGRLQFRFIDKDEKKSSSPRATLRGAIDAAMRRKQS